MKHRQIELEIRIITDGNIGMKRLSLRCTTTAGDGNGQIESACEEM